MNRQQRREQSLAMKAVGYAAVFFLVGTLSATAQDPAAPAAPPQRLVLPGVQPVQRKGPAPLLPGALEPKPVAPLLDLKAPPPPVAPPKPATKTILKPVVVDVPGQAAPVIRAVPVEIEVAPANRGVLLRGISRTSNESAQPAQASGLNTSEELERLLERAIQVAAERPDLAPVLWQRILDEGAATFARGSIRNGVPLRRSYEVYRPFADESLRSLVAAGTEALRQYRLHSDGPARALLARQGGAREAALGEIVRRYFLTTVGDDAAFELGCRYLELANLTAADHLFERLSLYPDSNIASDDIAIRRAVAQSRLGRADVATQLVETLGTGSEAIKPLLLADFEAQQSNANSGHVMATLMKAPAGLGTAGLLEPGWEFLPTWSLKGVKPSTNNQAIMSGTVNGRPMIYVRQPGGNYVQTALQDKDIPDLSLSQLATNWRAAAWRPTSQPIVAEGRIYLKSESRTVCCDSATGQVVWMGRPTQFPLDDWSRQLAQIAAHGVNFSYPAPTTTMGPQPKTMTEIMLFADRLNQGLAVGDGRLFAIEGELETPATKKQAVNTPPQRAAFVQIDATRQQGRRNELACYGASTGKLQWTVSGAAIVAEGTTFLSAPLLLGNVLVVATGTESQLGIAALNVADGALVWKTTLSDLTARTAQAIPVGLTADDGCIYVANGAGTLFSIDRNGGALRWAVTYPRTRSGAIDRQAAAMGRIAMVGGMAASGASIQVVLDENFIARQGGTIVVAPSDSDHVMAFNVTDGSLRWDSPLPPAVASGPPGYVLGTRDGRVYLGSSKWLWCINLNGGRIVWDTPLESSCGRGTLTSESLLVPQGRTIVQLDPATGKLLRTTEIETPDNEPVGNLLSDGRQLVVAGAARLLAMKPAGTPKPEGAKP